jgi:predicted acetyltransferase
MTPIRELTDDDAAQSTAQTTEAFGAAPSGAPARVAETRYGLFDGDRLAAQAFALRWATFVGGVPIPTTGIGNVTVAPEDRGGGTAQRLMSEVLANERSRGAVLSGLFGGAPALYRRLGYGLIDRSVLWRIPLPALAGVRPTAPVALRPASAEDADDCAAVYAESARAGTAAMDRSGAQPWAPWSRATVAVSEGRVIGYLAFHSERVDGRVVIRVDELVARTADGYRALLGSLASWASVAETVTMQAGNAHPALALLRGNPIPLSVAPYMLRIVDLQAAVQLRGWAGADGQAVLRLDDPILPENDGTWLLTAEQGRAKIEPTTRSPDAALTSEGLALWYSGVARLAQLRTLGLGGGTQAERFLDALAVAPPPSITEFF